MKDEEEKTIESSAKSRGEGYKGKRIKYFVYVSFIFEKGFLIHSP